MNEPFSTAGLKALFSYPFRQAGWTQKFVIMAGLILAGYIIPILPWIVAAGYAAELMRRTALGQGEPELPEWNDWGSFFVDGLRLTGVGLVYTIPLLVIIACGFGPYFTSFVGMIAVGGDDRAASLLTPLLMGSSMFIILSMFCSLIYSFLVGIPLPAAMVHVAVTRSFTAFFKVSDWWKVFRANIGGFIIATLLVWVIAFVMQFLTQILVSTFVLCLFAFLVPIAITPYITVLGAYLFGQAYREGTETLGLTPVEPIKNEAADPAI